MCVDDVATLMCVSGEMNLDDALVRNALKVRERIKTVIERRHIHVVDIQKQADVTNESLEKLDGRRDDFKAAKDAYTAAWAAAKADVDAATAKLTPLKKELACRLSEQKRLCLVEVWEKVKAEIRECVGERGCRRFDCDFNESVTEADTQATLSGRISELRQKADEMDAYERVLGAAMAGDSSLFAREDYVEEAWRIVEPVLKKNTPVYQYDPHTWGPDEVERVSPHGGWHNPAGKEALALASEAA